MVYFVFTVLPCIQKVKGHIHVTTGKLGHHQSSPSLPLVFTRRSVVGVKFTSGKVVIYQEEIESVGERKRERHCRGTDTDQKGGEREREKQTERMTEQTQRAC